uniref:Neuronal acetylcholine receptor subunit alpha-3 n=1 Tax=Caligus rogercresseyi TaxID=217165 RepID=C1BNZ4_CALRO|nr:Neuronal acetylcholine receptor subunit alpha-3 precursor [Caligus rogercresseyi]
MDQMLHLVTLFLLFWTSHIQCSRLSIHQSLRDELFSDYNPLSAPLDPSKPILIQFHITPKYFDVRDDGFIEGEFWYSWVWRDSRLTWNETEASVPRIRVDRDMIWRPDIVPLSGDVKEEFDDRISALVDNDGQVTWSPKVFLRARCSGANFKDPWKEFRCTLKYGSWNLPRDIIDFYEGSASGMYNDPDSPVDVSSNFGVVFYILLIQMVKWSFLHRIKYYKI